jgi:rare lipoprotein A
MRLVAVGILVGILCALLLIGYTEEADGRSEAQAVSSWYGPGLYGNRTADGTVLTPRTWGVAHKTLPLGAIVRVCRTRCVLVRVIDRGPFVRGRDFDLTYAAARVAGVTRCGVCRVYWTRVR